MLGCQCFNTDGTISPASCDLSKYRLHLDTYQISVHEEKLTQSIDQIIWNHDGYLGCYNHAGNKSSAGPDADT